MRPRRDQEFTKVSSPQYAETDDEKLRAPNWLYGNWQIRPQFREQQFRRRGVVTLSRDISRRLTGHTATTKSNIAGIARWMACRKRRATTAKKQTYLGTLQHRLAALVEERLSHGVRREIFLLGQIEGGIRINIFRILGYSFQGAHLAAGRLLSRFPHGGVILLSLFHIVFVVQSRLCLRARIVRASGNPRLWEQRRVRVGGHLIIRD